MILQSQVKISLPAIQVMGAEDLKLIGLNPANRKRKMQVANTTEWMLKQSLTLPRSP